MEYVIYGDVLVAVNFIIDLLILRLCQPLTGIRQRGPRPYLAAAAGGLCSMVIFLPSNSLLLDLFIRLALSFIVVSIAYGRQRPGVFLRLLGVFYAVSFLVETLRNAEEPITIVAVGPASNLGMALRMDPDIDKNIKQIIIMGAGAIRVSARELLEEVQAAEAEMREIYMN